VNVRPMVQQDSLINLRVYPRVSDLMGWSPKGMPIVFERSVSTEVKVKDNAVFVLGGLKKREAVEVRRGIPGLKDIPVLQWLFSVKKEAILEREVLIFIRPTTNVTTSIDTEEIGAFMEKYNKTTEKKRRRRRAE
jgi:type II secretory pathway component GspD/PulD (secretin)